MFSRDETKVHRELAMSVVSELGKMKGLPMKVGQILSYMDGAVPEEYRDVYREVLGQLCTQSLPMGAESYRAVFEEELGSTPEDVFDSFEATPIAAASIGQVHRAVLAGQPVCVKIQYPGIAEATVSDLENVGALMSVMRTIMPNVDTRQMIEDFRTRLAEECDYRQEAAYQSRFAETYARDADILVPEVIDHLSSRRVLTTRFVEGIGLDEFVANSSAEARDHAGKALFRLAFEGILEHGLFHADPHPGNFLFNANGTNRVAVLDYGCVQPIDADARADLRALVHQALGRGDVTMATERAFGITDVDDVSRQALAEIAPLMLAPILADQPYHFTRAYAADITRVVIDMKKKLATRYLARRSRITMNREGVMFVMRTLIGLASIWGTIEPRADFNSLTRQVLSSTPPVIALAGAGQADASPS